MYKLNTSVWKTFLLCYGWDN